MAVDQLDRLLSKLNISGLQQKNTPLYEIIAELIKRVKTLSIEESSSGSGSGSTTINQFFESSIPGLIGEDGEDGSIGPPGVSGEKGTAGSIGPAGPTTIGPMGIDGSDGEDGSPIPGSQGIQGSQGLQGIPGPPTIGPMGINGLDGDDGMPIPGPVGPIGPQGIPGPPTIGPIGLDGEDGLDGFSIPGPSGPAGSSNIEAWEGHIVGCWGNGDPAVLVRNIMWGSTAPSPGNISATIARVSYFKLRTSLVVTNIRWFGVGNNTGLYHIAIYRQSDNVRMSGDHTIDTVTNTWGVVASSFTLDAGVLYYVAVSGAAGGVAGIAAYGNATKATTTGDMRLVATSWPGGMELDRSPAYLTPYVIGQVTVTASALPDPGNVPAHASGWAGGMPAVWLDAE